MCDWPRAPHAAPLRVGVLNLPQGVALVTTRPGQTPPAPKFVLGFPGFHPHHGNSFGLGTFSSALAPVDFKSLRKSRAKARPLQMQPRTRLQELIEAEEFAAEGAAVSGPFGFAGVDGEGGAAADRPGQVAWCLRRREISPRKKRSERKRSRYAGRHVRRSERER